MGFFCLPGTWYWFPGTWGTWYLEQTKPRYQEETGSSDPANEKINQQEKNQIDATLKVKEQSVKMKEALLKGELDKIGNILNVGWEYKKLMAEGITNPDIEKMYQTAINAGAIGGKISGAGGGGFMFFYCPNNTRFDVIKAISELDIKVTPYEFAMSGLYSYTIN